MSLLYIKYEKVIIEGLPKKFNIKKILDFLYKGGIPENPYCEHYGLKIVTEDESKNKTCIVFRKNLSSTGVVIQHNAEQSSLTFLVSEFASDADVVLFASLMNAVLKNHPRAKAFDEYSQPVKYIGAREIEQMNTNRIHLLERLLTTKDDFEMYGINHNFILKVEHLIPYSSLEMQAYELKKMFVEMQWKVDE
ncbi:MAG: hypothetical protein KBS95_06780 [Alistipes sp.]|nr:hypothetical protein [Candidatus Alistipes equi]